MQRRMTLIWVAEIYVSASLDHPSSKLDVFTFIPHRPHQKRLSFFIYFVDSQWSCVIEIRFYSRGVAIRRSLQYVIW